MYIKISFDNFEKLNAKKNLIIYAISTKQDKLTNFLLLLEVLK